MPGATHSSISASSCERWWNCPASVQLSVGLPNRQSIYAAEGTAAHSLAERILRGTLQWKDAVLMEGQVIREGQFDVEVTREMIDGAREYADMVKSIRVGMAGELHIEKRLALKSVDPRAFGYLDAGIVSGTKIAVCDYKYGKGHAVEVVGNKQMMYYALGLAETAATWPEEVQLWIIQPRAKHSGGRSRSWTMTGMDLFDFATELREKISETRAENPKIQCGEWCTFCNAKAVCPAMRDKAKEVAMVEFAAAPVEPKLPELLTETELGLVLNHMDVLSEWLNAVKEHAKGLLKSGVPLAGWKMVRGKKSRAWSSEDEIKTVFEPVLGDALYEPKKLLSPAKLEKVIGKKEVEPYIVSSEGAPTIAREDDPREEISYATAGQEFAPIETETTENKEN